MSNEIANAEKVLEQAVPTAKRVNKVTARFDGEMVVLTMYKTNDKLGTLTSKDIGMGEVIPEGVKKQAYLEQCKDVLVQLLNNNGVQGFYYDDASYQQENGIPKKLDSVTFTSTAVNLLSESLGEIGESAKLDDYSFNSDVRANITESYKDGYIKYASIVFPVSFTRDGLTFKGEVEVSVKSGQFCKPKSVTLDTGKTMNLNARNVAGLFKKEEPVVESDVAITESAMDVQ